MQKLAVTDRAFLLAESREAPMHVGGVNLYTVPEGEDQQEFMSGLREFLSTEVALRYPFGQRLKSTNLGIAGTMSWEEDPNLDMHYHVPTPPCRGLAVTGNYLRWFPACTALGWIAVVRSGSFI
jgi:hypothetical protein